MPSRPYKDLLIYGCFVLNRLVADMGIDLYQDGLEGKLEVVLPNQVGMSKEEVKREIKSNHFMTDRVIEAVEKALAARRQFGGQVGHDPQADLLTTVPGGTRPNDFDLLLRHDRRVPSHPDLQVLKGRMEGPEDLSDPPARLKPFLEQPLRIPLIQPLDHLPDEAAREERNSLDVLGHAIRFPGREDLGRVPALTEHTQGDIQDLVREGVEGLTAAGRFGRQRLRRAGLDGDFLLGHTGVALPFFQ